jgi:hypothetical protein
LMALWLVVSMCLVSISFTVLLTLHHLRWGDNIMTPT